MGISLKTRPAKKESPVRPGDLDLDHDFQVRVAPDQGVVDRYAEAMAAGEVFPPVEVWDIGTRMLVVDGFHRVLAALKLNLATIPAVVHVGTEEEATLAAAGANATHGVPRTKADIEQAIRLLWGRFGEDMPHRDIAAAVKLSPSRASEIVREMKTGQRRDRSATGRPAAGATEGEAPRGRSLVDGVEQDDPPDVAARRASGHIPADAVPEVTTERPAAGADEEGDAPFGEAAPQAPPEQTAEEWAESLPLADKLEGQARQKFIATAACWKKMEPALRDFKNRVRNHVAEARKANFGEHGPGVWRVHRLVMMNGPERWVMCPPKDKGGCGGQGWIGMLSGECPNCKGWGFREV